MTTSVELAKAALEKYQAKLAELEARQSPQPGEIASDHRILAEYQQILLLRTVVADFATLVGAELASSEPPAAVKETRAAKELVVYRGWAFHGSQQYETIVAVRTKVRARDLLKITSTEFKNFTRTMNPAAVDAAMAKPEVVFFKTPEGWVERPAR